MLDKQYWGLDPLFTNHLKLFICTIKKLERLEEYEDLFLLGSHVVQFAQIYGVIVAVERNYAMDTYIVDDGTDCLPCCVWNDSGRKHKRLQLGSSVRVRGRISEFNATRQITVENIDVVLDLHEESLHYLQAAYLLKNVYLKPFTIPKAIAEKKEKIEELFKREIDEESNVLETDSQQNVKDGDEDDVLESEILSFISSNYSSTEFPSSVARDQEEIVKRMVQILRKRERKRPDDRRLTDYYNKRFEALLREGHIVELQGRDRLYRLLPMGQLKRTIIDIMEETKEALGSNYGGVTSDYIALRVRQHDLFQTLPNERIYSCLRKMVDESSLYLTSPKEYAVVPNTYA